MTKKFVGYQCSLCGKQYGPEEVTYVCPDDGGNLNVLLDYEGIKNNYSIEDITSSRDTSIWRYLPLLPVDDPGCEGTPCVPRVGRRHMPRLPCAKSWA